MKDHFLSLYRYTFWADEQLLDCVAGLSDAQLAQERPYTGSIWSLLYHIYQVEYWWFHFLRTGQMPDGNAPEHQSLEWLRQRWAENQKVALAYIGGMDGGELNRKVKPPHWDEDEAPAAAWQAMIQVANHSTDHRAQVLRVLYDLGVPTFEQDYLNYLDTLS